MTNKNKKQIKKIKEGNIHVISASTYKAVFNEALDRNKSLKKKILIKICIIGIKKIKHLDLYS